MSDFLTRLISVGRESASSLRPRLPSRFAPTATSTQPEMTESEGSPALPLARSTPSQVPAPLAEPNAQRVPGQQRVSEPQRVSGQQGVTEQKSEVSVEAPSRVAMAPRTPQVPSEALPDQTYPRLPSESSHAEHRERPSLLTGLTSPRIPSEASIAVRRGSPSPLTEGSSPPSTAPMDPARWDASAPEVIRATRSQGLAPRASSAWPPFASEVASEGGALRPGQASSRERIPGHEVTAPPRPPHAREAQGEESPPHSTPDSSTATRPATLATRSVAPATRSATPARSSEPEHESADEARAPHPSSRWQASAPISARDTREAASLPRESPTVRITIGRIDVRATTPSAAPAPRPGPAPAPAMSLEAYLKRRGGGT